MRQPKGLVMEVSGGTALVLSSEGELVALACGARQFALGDEIELGDEIDRIDEAPGPVKVVAVRRSWVRWLSGLAAAVVLFAVVGSYRMWSTLPVAVLAVDINPSVELSLDRNRLVGELQFLNDDARRAFTGMRLRGKPIIEAVDLIVQRAVELGYMRPDETGFIMATFVPMRGSASFDMQALEQAIRARTAGTVIVSTARTDLLEKAREARLSVNKYIAVRVAQAHGKRLALEDLRTTNIPQAFMKIGLGLETLNSLGNPATFDDATAPEQDSFQQESTTMDPSEAPQATPSLQPTEFGKQDSVRSEDDDSVAKTRSMTRSGKHDRQSGETDSSSSMQAPTDKHDDEPLDTEVQEERGEVEQVEQEGSAVQGSDPRDEPNENDGADGQEGSARSDGSDDHDTLVLDTQKEEEEVPLQSYELSSKNDSDDDDNRDDPDDRDEPDEPDED